MNRKLKLEELNRVSIIDFKSKERSYSCSTGQWWSLHNVGSVFRTCDAMAVEKLYLGGISKTTPQRNSENSYWSYRKC